ncbi:MAG: VCBS repeat-containing protein [Akkermansiaceae bacterium]
MKRFTLFALVLVSCSEKEEEVPVTVEKDAASIEEQMAILPVAEAQIYDKTVHDIVVREDPKIDGWDSEAFSETAMTRLKELGKLLIHGEFPLEKGFFSGDSEGEGTAQEQGSKIYERSGVTVVRGGGPTRLNSPLFTGVLDPWVKFKIIDVQLEGGKARTEVIVQAAGKNADGSRQQINAEWSIQWVLGDPLLIQEIHIQRQESVASQRGFVDCTAEALSDRKLVESQFVYGRDHWFGQFENALGVEGRGNGIAIGDVNNDGLEDLYLCQSAGLPNRLLLRQLDGSLKDISASAGVDWLDTTRGALFVDLDNDGDQDLALTLGTHLVLHENMGNGTFPVRAALTSKSVLFSLNAVDFDNDGDLDLFTCGYSGAEQISPQDVFASPMPYHDANNGAPNALLANGGDWSFRDVTAETGLDVHNLRFSLASAWEDFDNDGDQDLYVANDFGRNNLYRNDGEKFIDVAAQAGVEDIGPGMSVAWGDVNNDGLSDLYVSNMFSSAGNRITRQKQFQPGMTAGDLDGFKRHARGNSLYLNQGDGTFKDVAKESGTMIGRWAWGSLFVDLNNDGWRDLYVTNGFVTAGKREDDL